MSLIGVAAALQAASDPSISPKRTIFDEFSLNGKVAVVTGGNRGLGLEMALALCEAGAIVHALDLPEAPGEEFTAASEYAKKLGSTLKYVSADVTHQKDIWVKFAAIGDAEGRLDICIAAAGIVDIYPCLTYEADDFQRIINVNTNGVFYTAQGAGQQMTRFGIPGSIILIASVAGTITLQDIFTVAYQSSKAAVLQMARSMACELGRQKIRVNTISPGWTNTKMIAPILETKNEALRNQNPLGRIGRPDEMRGVAVWLASDASSFSL
ncbi:beta-keto acyl carrier reductase [Rhizoctonia solani 123E]|uniref:Beta-keto acyl carrier reductase n=1 Tax=Rhizoctonia solani 123E TaxID=1423351 RepID=A0A074RKH3_9AGAM|nr:beta-keto acyl carrier reductase [Rhizoctonia solani 123E]